MSLIYNKRVTQLDDSFVRFWTATLLDARPLRFWTRYVQCIVFSVQ